MWERYFQALREKLDAVQASQGDAICRAAGRIADRLAEGGMLYTFGCGHSALLSQEIYYRAGGLMLVEGIFGEELLLHQKPVTITSQFERLEGYARLVLDKCRARPGDILLVISTSGRNAVPVEMAVAGRERQLVVIALTSTRYAADLPSRHPSGKRLFEAADIVLDNLADPGDASVAVEGLTEKVGPTSTAVGAAILQALVLEVVAELIARGVEPPVFLSGNVPGGDEHNARLLARYGERVGYL
jgi:uncharacterized phosphosugar-binding protein